MTKRFCDTEIWQKDWFLNLSDKQKLLTKFLFDNCDCAGIYEISWRMLKVFFTTPVTAEDFKQIKQVKFLDENTIFIEDFIFFQCGIKSLKDLNPNNNAHKGIIKRLKKFNINSAPGEPLASPSNGADKPHIRGAQEKEKEEEKEKEDTLSSFASFLLSENFEEAEKQPKKNLTSEERTAIISKFYKDEKEIDSG